MDTELPFNIAFLIDDSIDDALVPFSGPAGDFEGAPCRARYADAQESIYWGWKKLHGVKVDTLFFPNGMSTVFGPVSCRANDRGTLNLSRVGEFLGIIQAQLPNKERCM